MEHMIVALHNHSFLLLVIAMVAVFGAMENWLALPVILQTLSAELAGLILFWVPIYYLLSLKRVYQQSWKMTIFKFFAIGFAYLFLIVLGFVINLILAILFL
jgi:cytochrome c biogenesis protein ResB